MGLIRILFFFFLIYILYSLIKKVFGTGSKISGRDSSSGIISEMVQDPYCKTYIPRNEAYKIILGGEEIMFCSRECADKYKSEVKS